MCPAAHPKATQETAAPDSRYPRCKPNPSDPPNWLQLGFYSNTLKRARTRVTSAHTVRAPAPSTTPQVRLARRNDTFPSRSSRSCFGARRPRSRASRASVKRSNFFFGTPSGRRSPYRVFGSRARAPASRSRRGAGVACFLSRVRAPGWPPGARGDREVACGAGLAAVVRFSRQRTVAGPTPLCAVPGRAYPSLGSSYRAGVPSPDGVFARDMRSGERLASCRSGERLASCVR